MRRTAVIAALTLAFAVSPTSAQMRAGVRSAPPARSGGMAHAPMTAPRGMVHLGVPQGAVHFGTFHSGSFHNCWGCQGFHHHRGFRPWWWGGFAYPYYGYGYGYGYSPLLWDSNSSYSSDQDSANQRDMLRQIDDLSQEVQRLREELRDSAYQQPAPPQPAPPPAEPPKPSADPPASSDLPTILVFRDQRIQEVQSYAIVGKTLVVVADQRSKKIPLTDLDVPATTKLNDERGVYFTLPR